MADPTVYVKFYAEPKEDARLTGEAGRPIFVEKEFVEIQQAGDRKRVHVAPAHEPFQLERSSGHHVTYAERYPEQYAAFKRQEAVFQSGTPIDMVPFLTPSLKAEYKAQMILTVEALAGLGDNVIAKFGPNMRGYVRQAQEWLAQTKDSALATKLAEENAALNERIAKLEAMMTSKAEAPAKAAGTIDDLSDDDLRARLEAKGINVRANASRERLLAAVKDLG